MASKIKCDLVSVQDQDEQMSASFTSPIYEPAWAALNKQLQKGTLIFLLCFADVLEADAEWERNKTLEKEGDIAELEIFEVLEIQVSEVGRLLDCRCLSCSQSRT